MPDCPRCHQLVDVQAIACPYCRAALKACGHPGIPLYRAAEEEHLCQTCTYQEDDTCNFPQRPYAKECTLYYNRYQQSLIKGYTPSRLYSFKGWFRRNAAWIALASLVLVSLLLALSGR